MKKRAKFSKGVERAIRACFACGDEGHQVAECDKPELAKAWLEKRKRGIKDYSKANGEKINLVELVENGDEGWYFLQQFYLPWLDNDGAIELNGEVIQLVNDDELEVSESEGEEEEVAEDTGVPAKVKAVVEEFVAEDPLKPENVIVRQN